MAGRGDLVAPPLRPAPGLGPGLDQQAIPHHPPEAGIDLPEGERLPQPEIAVIALLQVVAVAGRDAEEAE